MTATQANPISDADLLHRYAAAHCAESFATLAGRYLPLIYSAALRQTRDRHLAEDVAQATLIILSQKAGRIDPALLPGWLLKTTHYAASNAMRQKTRRAAHEQRAAAMKSECDTPHDPDAVARVIDPALARLRDADRTAVVLRYFQNKSFAEIAQQLHTSESAAQRRIARAVEKLRGLLARQGVAIAPAALPAALAAQTLHPVPPSLVLHATAMAGSKAAPTSLIAKGALHAMAAAKTKAVVATAAAVLLVGTAVPTAYHFATADRTPPAPSAPSVPAPLPPGTDMSRPIDGSLPPGMTAEPLAIMSLADKRWLRPTGGELTDPPIDLNKLLSHIHIQGATHVMLFRINTPDESIRWSYSLAGSGMYGSTGSYDASTRTHYQLHIFRPNPGTNSVSMTVNAATGPWTENAVIPASATGPTSCNVLGFPVTFDPPVQRGNQVRITCATDRGFDRQRPTLCEDFYALDAAGRKIGYIGMSSDNRKEAYDFDGNLSTIKEFHLRTRPYNYHATYAAIPLPSSR